MNLDELRGKLREALRDPRRHQLAHIAVLDIAMATGRALEAKRFARSDIEAATEALSAYLKGEINELPKGPPDRQVVVDTMMEAIRKVTQEPSFGSLFK